MWILLICTCTFSFSLFLFLQGCRNLCNIISSYTHIILVCVTLTFLSWLKIFLNIMFSGLQDSSTTCATIDEMTCVIWHLSRQQCFIVINMMVMEVFVQNCDVSGYRFPEVELLDQRIEILFRFLIQKDQRLSRMWFHFVLWSAVQESAYLIPAAVCWIFAPKKTLLGCKVKGG